MVVFSVVLFVLARRTRTVRSGCEPVSKAKGWRSTERTAVALVARERDERALRAPRHRSDTRSATTYAALLLLLFGEVPRALQGRSASTCFDVDGEEEDAEDRTVG